MGKEIHVSMFSNLDFPSCSELYVRTPVQHKHHRSNFRCCENLESEVLLNKSVTPLIYTSEGPSSSHRLVIRSSLVPS